MNDVIENIKIVKPLLLHACNWNKDSASLRNDASCQLEFKHLPEIYKGCSNFHSRKHFHTSKPELFSGIHKKDSRTERSEISAVDLMAKLLFVFNLQVFKKQISSQCFTLFQCVLFCYWCYHRIVESIEKVKHWVDICQCF